MSRKRLGRGTAAGRPGPSHRARRGALALGLMALLVAAAGPAYGARGRPVAYRGKSGQGMKVHLSRPFSYGRTFRYQATLSCSDGTSFTEGVFSDDVRMRHRRFRDRYSSHGGAEHTTVSGRLRGRRASGDLRIVERYSPTPNAAGVQPLDPQGSVICDTGPVTWKARARR